ncbi:MAG: BspA family leucine-rich repeat surface protein, partial [Cyclobacteriaceae bacterium]
MNKIVLNTKLLLGVVYSLISLNLVQGQSITYTGTIDVVNNPPSLDAGTLDISFNENNSSDIAFNGNGDELFVIGQSNVGVNQFSFGVSFDFITNVPAVNCCFSVSSQESLPGGIAFNPDGTKLFVSGNSGGEIHQYSLTTPYDLFSGVTYDGSPLDLATLTGDARVDDFVFMPGGTRLFALGASGSMIHEFSLSNAYDITSGVSYTGSGVDISSQTTTPTSIDFDITGTKLFVGDNGDKLYQWTLEPAFDTYNGTATYDGNFETTHDVSGFSFNPDDNRYFVVDRISDQLYQYSMSANVFKEKDGNLGDVQGSLNVSLSGDTFTSKTLIESNLTIHNLPAGLTPSVTLISDSLVNITLEGNAVNHTENDDVADLQITFGDGAFTGGDASSVTNATAANTGLGIEFPEAPFITTWETTTASESITIPTTGTGYNYTVDWGDGTVISGYTGDATHEYASANTYTVSITGDFPRICFNNSGDKDKIQTIEQWGDIQWSSMLGAFYGCANLTYNAADAPDLTSVGDLSNMFRGASSFNGNINNWDVSNVNKMGFMFYYASSFNQPLDSWDVSSVWSGSARYMFSHASSFNQDLSSWDISGLSTLGGMFKFATSFNGNIENWDVSNVTSMNGVFDGATSFNRDISSWDVSNVIDMGNALTGTALSQSNYDATLQGWARLDPGETQIPTNLPLGATGLEFCEGAAARQALIDDYGWTISGDAFACDGLVAYYPFNGNANDSTSNNNDGAVNGAVRTTDRFGNDSSAYFFDGTDDYINGTGSTDFGFSDFTVSAWIRPEDAATQGIFSTQKASTGSGLAILTTFSAGNGIAFHLGTFASSEGPVTTDFPGTKTYVLGEWIHVVGVRNGTGMDIYIDGIESANFTSALSLTSNSDFVIGRITTDGSSNYFEGAIDDVKVFDRALSASEIQDLYYEGGYSPPAENVVPDVDENDYSGVVIGTQVWMGENLATSKYNDGTTIPKVTDNTAWSNLTTPGYAWYDNDSATNAPTYGALYNWYAVETGELCPTGWHVPSDTEWTTLEDYLIANGYNYDGTTSGNKLA